MSENQPKKRRGRAGRTLVKWIKRIILLAIVLAAALFGLKAYIRSQAQQRAETKTSYARAQVKRGTIEETVYGTGTTSARNQPNVLAEADGTLTDLRVAVGDEVKKGDILAVITNEEIDDTITDLEFSLWDLDAQITDTAAGSKVTRIDAPAAGRVVAIYAEAGDDALAVFRREGALAIISTDERMKVVLTGEKSALGLELDEKVRVTGDQISAEGTVVELTRQGTQATITVMESALPMDKDLDGDGMVDQIMGRTVEVRKTDGTLIGTGELQANKPMAVSAFGGTIQRVDAVLGGKISRTERMFRLEDSPLTLKIENLRLQREAAAKELNTAIEQRENLIVIAPCDGVVASLEVAEGDEITSGTLIGSILEGEDMNLTIAVDELDVVKVEAGQKVDITIDALSKVKMSGEVYKLAPVGDSSGGVTTYKVELTFDAAGTGVRSGMNATGEIRVATAENTLYVPVEALMTVNNKTYVMVEDGGTMPVSAPAQISSQIENPNGNPSGSQRGSRGQGGMLPDGQMPDRSGLSGGEIPAFGEGMPDRSTLPQMPQTADDDGQAAEDEPDDIVGKARRLAMDAYEKVRAWLFEGVQESVEQQASGALVQVAVGLKNDDYAEIQSGLSEGDIVLYTTGESSSSQSMPGGMMMGGSFGGMGGAPGGAPGGR